MLCPSWPLSELCHSPRLFSPISEFAYSRFGSLPSWLRFLALHRTRCLVWWTQFSFCRDRSTLQLYSVIFLFVFFLLLSVAHIFLEQSLSMTTRAGVGYTTSWWEQSSVDHVGVHAYLNDVVLGVATDAVVRFVRYLLTVRSSVIFWLFVPLPSCITSSISELCSYSIETAYLCLTPPIWPLRDARLLVSVTILTIFSSPRPRSVRNSFSSLSICRIALDSCIGSLVLLPREWYILPPLRFVSRYACHQCCINSERTSCCWVRHWPSLSSFRCETWTLWHVLCDGLTMVRYPNLSCIVSRYYYSYVSFIKKRMVVKQEKKPYLLLFWSAVRGQLLSNGIFSDLLGWITICGMQDPDDLSRARSYTFDQASLVGLSLCFTR